jgi:hypothetical protein
MKMARIRNIKPEFYSHEELQDMEIEHPELHPMLVFSALWTQCEWSGVFHWSIRKLKLAILPFLEYDLEKTLEYLEAHGFIKKFSKEGKDYGYVYNFTKYQAISGKEKEQELKYPIPDMELDGNYTETTPEQERNESGSPDSDSDIDIGLRQRHKNLPPQKPIALLNREPKNDMEKVNKKWLENYIAIHGEQPINIRWDITSPLVSKAIKQVGVEKVLQALDTAKADNFCLQSGYMLKIIMSSNVISRLINKPPSPGPPPSQSKPKDRNSIPGGLEV